MSGLVHRILELPGWLVLLVAGLVVFTEDAILVGSVVPGETLALLAGAAAKLGHVLLAGVLMVYYLRMRAGNQTCRRSLPDDQVDLAVEAFRMLADGTRVRLLWALIGRELSVNELATEVGKPATSVSQHLAKLRMSRMVATRREGTQVFYRLENEHVGRLVTDAIHNAEHSGPGVPGHHLADRDLVQLHRGTEGA